MPWRMGDGWTTSGQPTSYWSVDQTEVGKLMKEGDKKMSSDEFSENTLFPDAGNTSDGCVENHSPDCKWHKDWHACDCGAFGEENKNE